MKSLIDNWKGYYEFGFGYEPPIFGSRVNFNLFFTGKEDEFYGECIEENNENLINEISKIAGFVDNGLISFKKIYENTEVINEEGSIDFIKGREAVFFYYGEYNKKYDCIFGYWEISPAENGIDIDDNIELCRGIWECYRN